MSLLMCGWCLVLMGIYYINLNIFLFGIIFTCMMIYCIRNQIFIDESQYIKGMIPHHSMAVLMSKQLLEKDYFREINLSRNIKILAKHIINKQNDEIDFMKYITNINNIKKVNESDTQYV
jgi:hypothetical protein